MSKRKPTHSKKIQLTPIEFPQFDAFIHYFIEDDREKAREFLLSKGYEHETRGSGLTVCYKGKDPLVWLHDKRAHVVAHEMIHAIIHMFAGIGHDSITRDNDELFAYLVDYSISQILK